MAYQDRFNVLFEYLMIRFPDWLIKIANSEYTLITMELPSTNFEIIIEVGDLNYGEQRASVLCGDVLICEARGGDGSGVVERTFLQERGISTEDIIKLVWKGVNLIEEEQGKFYREHYEALRRSFPSEYDAYRTFEYTFGKDKLKYLGLD